MFSGWHKLGAARAVGGGIISGGVSKFNATQGNVGKKLLAAVTGVAGGLTNSGREFMKDGSDANSIRQANQRYVDQNYERGASGSTVHGRALARLDRRLGLRTTAQRYDDDIKNLRESNAAWTRLESALNSDDSKLTSIKEIRGADGRLLFSSEKGFSVKDINDRLKDMENSGQYSANDLITVREILKGSQKLRFAEIAKEGDSGVKLTGTAGQVYQAANTIVDIGTKYSSQVNGFSAFANVKKGTTLSQALENGTLQMARDFKGGTYDAVRDADAKEASLAVKNAHEDDVFSRQNNKNG